MRQTKKQDRQTGPETGQPSLADAIDRLAHAVAERKAGRVQASPRVAKLLAAGLNKMSQKVVEEAAEVAIDAVRRNRDAVVRESVDLLFNLVVLWSELGLTPADVYEEMRRREEKLGMAEKLPKEGEAEEA